MQLNEQINLNGILYKCTGTYGGGHDGVDLDLVSGEIKGTNWNNLRAGIVRRVRMDDFGGLYVQIKHDDGTGHWTLHHDAPLVKEGQRVEAGQPLVPIAVCGNTGNVKPKPTASNPNAGSHVHLSFQTNAEKWNSMIDPTQFLYECASVTPPTPTPPANNLYTVKYGGWISNVCAELIAAGIWQAPNDQALWNHFYALNNPTPQGGYKPGMVVKTS